MPLSTAYESNIPELQHLIQLNSTSNIFITHRSANNDLFHAAPTNPMFHGENAEKEEHGLEYYLGFLVGHSSAAITNHISGGVIWRGYDPG